MIQKKRKPTAVILSAGAGNRMRYANGGTPKPLIRLLGRSLLERTILSCREAGVTDFLVVVGHQKQRVTGYAKTLEQRYPDITIQVVENPSWQLGNGTSALACEPYLSEPFLLLMCDHVFDPVILERLLSVQLDYGECLLAVDREMDESLDVHEATKVYIENGRIRSIGKRVFPSNGVDTGLFLCQPVLFNALREAQQEGDFTLSGGVRKLIESGRMRWVPADGLFWHDVDTPENLLQARQRLLVGLSKPSEDGWFSARLNRLLSRRISGKLAEWRVPPNAITIVSFLLAVAGGLLFALAGYAYTLLAGLLVQIASVVDGCDGEVARLNFERSPYGAWLDTVLDRYADAAIATGITYAYWQSHPGALPWIAGIAAAVGFLMSSYTIKEYSIRFRQDLRETGLGKLRKRDARLFLLLAGAVVNRPFEALLIVGLLSHLYVAWRLVAGYRDILSKRKRRRLEGRLLLPASMDEPTRQAVA